MKVSQQLKGGGMYGIYRAVPRRGEMNPSSSYGWFLSCLRLSIDALHPDPRSHSQHVLANPPDPASSLDPIAAPHYCVLIFIFPEGQCHGGVGVDVYIIIYPNTDNKPKLENWRESCHGGQNFYQYGAVKMATFIKWWFV